MLRMLSGWRRKDHGQSMAEITFVLPILLLVFTGMAEVGWWIHSYVIVVTAAREGARYGSRGLHLPTSEIADVTRVALSGTLDIDLYGQGANATILVTEVDVDPDGSYQVADTYKLGDLAVPSAVCLEAPCQSGYIDLKAVREENVAFNANPDLCQEALGCRNDVVVVEVVYRHALVLSTIFSRDFLPAEIPIGGRSVMRVLFRRNPWS